MTKKLLETYGSLSASKRILLITAILVLIVGSSVLTAVADSGITFSGQNPANGAVTPVAKPTIGVNVSTIGGVISQNDVEMFLNGQVVSPNVTKGQTEGAYTIQYTPVDALNDGNQAVSVKVYNSATASSQTANWTFKVDKSPYIVSLTPLENSKVATTAPLITVKVKDNFDNLNPNSVTMKLNGVSVTPTFTYKGRWYTDSCTGEQYYIVESNKEGTITYQANNLKDGVQNVEVGIRDANGNALNKQWSFTIGSKPVFSQFTPANGTTSSTNISKISVKVTDDDAINPATIVLKVNNKIVPHQFDAATGIITCTTEYGAGQYNVNVSTADMAGNVGTASWSFAVSTAAPNVKVYPFQMDGSTQRTDFKEGITITDGYLRFNAEITSSVDITPDTVLKVDGVVVPAEIRYEGQYDSCGSGYYYVTSKKRVYVNYQGLIADGPRVVTLYRADVLGNSGVLTWNINVNAKPVIKDFAPRNFINNTKPTISINVKDLNTGVDPSAIVMTLNGQVVPHRYEAGTGNVTYVPENGLPNEAYYTVSVIAKDMGGLTSNLTWNFYVNTYPEMYDANLKNCAACHATYPDSQIPFQSLHKNVSFYGTHSSNYCADCHNYVTYPADCLQCHGDEDGQGGWIDEAPHGSTPGIKYSLNNYDKTKAFRVLENREMWDCVICHQPGSPVLGWQGALVKPTRVLKNHDIPELHKAPASDCTKCHALSLTREHAREGRVDQAGKPIECNTCHQSTNPTVKAAITAKDKNCSACHGQADHDSMHQGGLDTNCQSCHNAVLTQEHISNATTAGKNYDCNTCHGSTTKQVKRTITNKSLNCAGCHSEGHNMLFVDKVPADIPLHNGFQWTTPIEASIFAGETSNPNGYNEGQVVISNRSQTVTPAQVWSWYNDGLTQQGWVLKTSQPEANATSFMVEFEKAGRLTAVKCYSSTNRDNTGAAAGTRIEVWYK